MTAVTLAGSGATISAHVPCAMVPWWVATLVESTSNDLSTIPKVHLKVTELPDLACLRGYGTHMILSMVDGRWHFVCHIPCSMHSYSIGATVTSWFFQLYFCNGTLLWSYRSKTMTYLKESMSALQTSVHYVTSRTEQRVDQLWYALLLHSWEVPIAILYRMLSSVVTAAKSHLVSKNRHS